MDHICGCIPASVRHALDELPQTLDETYERSLQEINVENRTFAHRMFQFVAVASRPLRIEELAELLAIDFDFGSIPRFHESWRPYDAVDAVLSTCSGLLTIVDCGSLFETAGGESLSETDSDDFEICPSETDSDDFEIYPSETDSDVSSEICPSEALEDKKIPKRTKGGFLFGKVVQFSHYSVKEFLMSARFSQSSDMSRYHVSMKHAHTLAAQVCLAILLDLDLVDVTSDRLAEWPLANYAAKHWVNHARFKDVSRYVEDGMKQLFDPNKPHFATWFRIRSLLEQRRQAESPSILRGAPLHYAVLWGFDLIVKFLVIEDPQDVNCRNFADDMTLLHLALMHEHVEVARVLLERGADVNPRDSANDITPLHLASMHGHVGVSRMLLERGADVNPRSFPNDITPLHLASKHGHVEVARMLVEYGAKVNCRHFANDMTPLHLALIRGHVGVARMLAEFGADADAQNEGGMSQTDMALVTRYVEVAGKLSERGAEVTAQDEDRNLLERGAGVTAQNKGGETPLHLASLMGRVKVARALIERGADFKARDNDGKTPLHLASQMGQVEVVRMLVERGADVAAKDKAGKTPSQLASQHGKEEVLWMLMELGADATAQHDDGETELASTLSSSPGNRRPLDNASVDDKHGADENAQNTDGSTPSHLASQEEFAAFKHVPLNHGADPGKMPASKSPPVTSSTKSPSDFPIPDPGEKPVSESPPATSSARTLAYCSLGIVAIAVVLPFFIRIVSRTSAVGRST